jgi:hypothetical protein
VEGKLGQPAPTRSAPASFRSEHDANGCRPFQALAGTVLIVVCHNFPSSIFGNKTPGFWNTPFRGALDFQALFEGRVPKLPEFWNSRRGFGTRNPSTSNSGTHPTRDARRAGRLKPRNREILGRGHKGTAHCRSGNTVLNIAYVRKIPSPIFAHGSHFRHARRP